MVTPFPACVLDPGHLRYVLPGVPSLGLIISLRTQRLLVQLSLVQFPVRAHAWVAGQVPSWGHERGNRSMYLLHIDVSLPLFLLSSL